MKSGIGVMIILIICALGYRHQARPEYQIDTSISMESPSEKETWLKVTVYRNHYAQELPRKIERFFVDMNGEPTTLQMELYFEGCSKPYKTVNFEY